MWFLAIYHLTQSKGGMSSIELARRLGTRQPTAWLIKHKLMAAMAERDAGKPKLEGRIEVDDAYLGGARRGGKRGRQDPVRGGGGDDRRAQAQAAAADRRQGLPQAGDRGPGQARLRCREQRGQRRPVLLDRGKPSRLQPLPAYRSAWAGAVPFGIGSTALPSMVTGSGPQAARWAPFTWINTALGNIKTALAGTYHHVSPKHAQRYLASFAWRFNRRFQLDSLTERLAYACARTAPHPYRIIVVG